MNDLLEARNNWIKNNVGDEQYHEFVKDLILQFLKWGKKTNGYFCVLTNTNEFEMPYDVGHNFKDNMTDAEINEVERLFRHSFEEIVRKGDLTMLKYNIVLKRREKIMTDHYLNKWIKPSVCFVVTLTLK